MCKFFRLQYIFHVKYALVVTIQKVHVEDVNRAHSFSLEQDTVANMTTIARNDPFTLHS